MMKSLPKALRSHQVLTDQLLSTYIGGGIGIGITGTWVNVRDSIKGLLDGLIGRKKHY